MKASDIPPNPMSLMRIVIFSIIWLGIIIVFYWSFGAVEFSFVKLIKGFPNMREFVGGMFPPDWSIYKVVLRETILTIQLALIGTTLAAIVAFPLSFCASRNTSPPWMYYIVRFLFNSVRAIDTLIFALIFVAWVGLGPFPGMLAMAIHSIGMLGKLFSEAIEGVDAGQVEALESVGASRLETIRWAIFPQVSSYFISYFLYRFEINIRVAVVLGLVGAGGIGFILSQYMGHFQYDRVSVLMITILVLVMSIDALSSKLRSRLL
jgi:phosphonate transport system permease protein